MSVISSDLPPQPDPMHWYCTRKAYFLSVGGPRVHEKFHCMIRPWGKAICPCPSTIFHSNNIRNGPEGPVILLHIDEMLERPGPNSTEKNRFTINCGSDNI